MDGIYFEFNGSSFNIWISEKMSQLPERSKTFLRMAANAVRDAMEAAAPKKTGYLSLSHVVRLIGEAAATVYPTASYADWVIHGRGDVYPVNKKVLHYFVMNGVWGGEVFSKHSGPSKPNDYRDKAIGLANSGISMAENDFTNWFSN